MTLTLTRLRPQLAALAAFTAILLQTPAQARSPAKLRTPAGKAPACLLTLEVRQLHWTLDPVEHVKDHMNALQFDIPADPDFCRDVKVGTLLDDKFRWGSWLFRQSYGQWSVRVAGKRIDGLSERADTVPPPSTSLSPPASPPPVTDAPVRAAPAPTSPVRPPTMAYDPGEVPALAPLAKPAGGDGRKP
jgi:hypothetical protein